MSYPILSNFAEDPWWTGTYDSYDDTPSLDTSYVCFGKGTLIETPAGYTKIEDLKGGDLVMSADGEPTKVLRMRHFHCPINEHTQPYVIMQGAFSPSTPFRDLVVSALHKIEYHGRMVSPIRLNEKGKKWIFEHPHAEKSIEYYHLEVENGVDLIANGIRAESLKPSKGNLDKFISPVVARVQELRKLQKAQKELAKKNEKNE